MDTQTPGELLTPAEYARWYASQSPCAGTTAALILAGGASSRMGQDKANLMLGGQTLLARAVAFWRTSRRVERVFVSVAYPDQFGKLPEGAEEIPDLLPHRGPMGGLHAAFRLTGVELLWVSGVDMPCLTREILLPPPGGDACVYRLEGRAEPLLGVYRRSALPVIESLLFSGEGSMQALLTGLRTRFVDADAAAAAALRNVNTPAQLLRMRAGTPPLIAVTGWSGTGKTTALEGIIPALKRRGLRVCAVKHDAHGFALDTPGKDTHRLTEAGAEGVALLGPQSWALLAAGTPSPEEMRPKLPPCDLILAEGFKTSTLLKVEIHRRATGKPLITRDDTLLAVLTDEMLDTPAPQLALEDYEGCADLLCRVLGLSAI